MPGEQIEAAEMTAMSAQEQALVMFARTNESH